MKRTPEPELMDTEDQARAYAAADFSEAHQSYVTLFHQTFPQRRAKATVLDLGCGPADVTLRFAAANPGYTFHAVDGSATMLRYARQALRSRRGLARRVRLGGGRLERVDVQPRQLRLYFPHDRQLSGPSHKAGLVLAQEPAQSEDSALPPDKMYKASQSHIAS